MKKNSTLHQEDFEALLGWLSSDREKAGEIYEQVRQGLLRFFRFKGCDDAESLADETINRVSAKITGFDNSKNVKTITYFYGFAVNILLEYNRKSKKESISLDDILHLEQPSQTMNENQPDEQISCLRNCLNELSAEDRRIILEYYNAEGQEKIKVRRELAEDLECEINTLHVRVFRLRNVLAKCIKKCAKKSL